VPRRKCRKDGHHNALSDCARDLGWQVWDTWQHAQYTPGWPDALWIGYGVILGEYKLPGEPLTPAEAKFRALCDAMQPKLYQVFETEDDVLRVTELCRAETIMGRG